MGKTVLITGASRGIGAGTARLFAENGWSVAINYLNSKKKAEELETLLKSRGHNAFAVKADVSDSAEVKKMTDEVFERFGRIDVLVNNAGIARQCLFGDIDEAEWDKLFAVNVKGVFLCSKAVLPFMIRQKRGKIINVSSIWGLVGASCETHYSAAKAAVIGLTKALAKELGPSGIQVNCVAPGVVATGMNSGLDEYAVGRLKDETPLGVIGNASDIANAIYFLASDKADFITGQVLSPNGGFVI
ncbi:MAG: 3-oxoacyl-ACP reductase FabG [Bacillota bacterium]|nr:3-oxoacyl-ACP reductase FabG [Bacillota bacterium]